MSYDPSLSPRYLAPERDIADPNYLNQLQTDVAELTGLMEMFDSALWERIAEELTEEIKRTSSQLADPRMDLPATQWNRGRIAALTYELDSPNRCKAELQRLRALLDEEEED